MFLKSLEDAVGEEQGEVCLHCEISKETATPVWRKDGLVLTADEKHEFLQFGKARALIIHSLSKDDAGNYTCDFGTSQTKAKVTVHGECLENTSSLLAERVELNRFSFKNLIIELLLCLLYLHRLTHRYCSAAEDIDGPGRRDLHLRMPPLPQC